MIIIYLNHYHIWMHDGSNCNINTQKKVGLCHINPLNNLPPLPVVCVSGQIILP